MALTFAASSAMDVDHGSGVDTGNAFTVATWIFPTTIDTKYSRIFDQSTATDAHQFSVTDQFDSGIVNSLDLYRYTSGTDQVARSAASTLSLNTWQFIAATVPAPGTNIKLYRGTLAASIIELSYDNRNAGTGTAEAANGNFLVGGDGTDANASFQGRIAWLGFWDSVLTREQLAKAQYRLHPFSGCDIFTHYGFNGTGTQADWTGSGNNGTVTGATASDHAPLAPIGFDSYLDNLFFVPRYGFTNFQIPGVV
jgi:hypothetical protein